MSKKYLTTHQARTKALGFLISATSDAPENDGFWRMIDDAGGAESVDGRRLLKAVKWVVARIEREHDRRRAIELRDSGVGRERMDQEGQ